MAFSASAAIANAKQESARPTQSFVGLCLKFVRIQLGVAAKYRSAAGAWFAAQHRHPGDHTPPVGVPVFWTGGGGGFGHIALSAGGGKVWSSDIARRGKVDLVDLDLIHARWGLTYAGWSEDLNGVRVYTPPKTPPFPGADAFRIGRSNPAVTALGKALKAKGFDRHNDGDGYQPGPVFTRYDMANCADFQRSRPELAGDPDGIPGPKTWKALFS